MDSSETTKLFDDGKRWKKTLGELEDVKNMHSLLSKKQKILRFEDVSVQESLLPEYSSYEQLDEMHWEVGSC